MKSVACSPFERRPARNLRRQRGVALITAVLIAALTVLIATKIFSRQQFDHKRTANILYQQQALSYVLGAEAWIGHNLRRDAQDNKVDHLGEAWATSLPALPIDGGYLLGRLEDQEGKLNLNNMLDGVQAERLQRLCALLNISAEFIPALQDWLDDDTVPRQGGAEDSSYLSDNYRAANGPMGHESELLAVANMTVEAYERLLPFITVLPENTYLNVNTAAPELLQASIPGLSIGEAQQLAAERLSKPFESAAAFLNHPTIAAKNPPSQGLGVRSHYFLLLAEVHLGELHFNLQSLLHRDQDNKTVTLQRRLGPLRLTPQQVAALKEADQLRESTD